MPGETVGIVGESGCGKSTTANVMCGLQSPTSGKVYFKGHDVTKRTADLRKQMGRVVSVVFQDPATALNPRMIVHDQLLDPLLVTRRAAPPNARSASTSLSAWSAFLRARCAPFPASCSAVSASASPSPAPCR